MQAVDGGSPTHRALIIEMNVLVPHDAPPCSPGQCPRELNLLAVDGDVLLET